MDKSNPKTPAAPAEVYTKIELWSRPLRRHAFFFTDIAHCKQPIISGGSALLVEAKKKASDSGLLVPIKDIVVNRDLDISDFLSEFDLGSQILDKMPDHFISPKAKEASPTLLQNNYDSNDNIVIHKEDKAGKKQKKASLKVRFERAIYDYSELEQEELEKKVADIINQDGFYDEVVPIDVGVNFDKKSNGLDLRVVGLLTALAVVVGMMIFMIKTMF